MIVPILSNFLKLKESLKKTRQNVFSKIANILASSSEINENDLNQIEEILISGDLGTELVDSLMRSIRSNKLNNHFSSNEQLKSIILNELDKLIPALDLTILLNSDITNQKPLVITLIGINGSGKTTTVAKLANFFIERNEKVILGAADTFRAAANDQVKEWAQRLRIDIVDDLVSDPSSIAYKTIDFAIKNSYDKVIIDTAGRLHNNKNLMLELSKMEKVINKKISQNQHFNLLVVDANQGQNIISQLKEFQNYIKIDGIIISKLDGTAKGGAILSVLRKTKIPIYFIGLGEQVKDFEIFDKNKFINALIN
jgi:fused signal recognition particle receptor